jgi:hypothetical protein
MAQLLIDHGADLSIRVTLPGHYEQLDEVIECTPLGYACVTRLNNCGDLSYTITPPRHRHHFVS